MGEQVISEDAPPAVAIESDSAQTPTTSLAQRRLSPELMDDPALDVAEHRRALNGLARLNALSAAAWPIWRELRGFSNRVARPIRVLDVATGSADVLVTLARRARRERREIEFIGADISATALAAARRRIRSGGVDCELIRLDALRDPWPQRVDVVICSLFLHHLAEPDAVRLLTRMRESTNLGVVISDLRRSPLGYLLALLASRALTRSRVVHVDALRSVRGAFTAEEFRSLAERAGMCDAMLRSTWPERIILRWVRG